MKKFTYRTKGTCSSQIELELDGNVVLAAVTAT